MILLTLAIVVAAVAFSILVYVLVIRLFASRSGVGRLCRAYAVDHRPAGPAWARQTLMIGSVQWKRCVTVSATEGGLYMRVDAILFRLPGVLIPWPDVHPVGKTLFYWRPAIRLSVGVPEITTITVHTSLCATMQPWMQGFATSA
jgi:hypothetical protein